MSLINSLKEKPKTWKPGDLITASDAARLLGYKSPKQFQDAERLQKMVREFAAKGCPLTTDIFIANSRRFLRAEINQYLAKLVEGAVALSARKREVLGLNV